MKLRESELVRTIISAGSELAKPPADTNTESPTSETATVTPIVPKQEEPPAVVEPAVEAAPSQAPAAEQQVASEETVEEPAEGSDDALKSLLGGLNE